MLKKPLAIVIMSIMICSLTACNRSTEQASSQNSSASVSSSSVSKSSDDSTVSESTQDTSSKSETQTQSQTTEYTANTGGLLNTSDLFSNRDLAQTVDLSEAVQIQASDDSTFTITEEGVYVLSGSAKNYTLKVEADQEAKVQIVLNGVTVTNESTPAIYVVSADKCFVTTAENTENTLSTTGTFISDSDTNTDAVIYSKEDIVLNGLGTLTISSANGNGVAGKDDIKITGGTYYITSALDSIEAKDFIAMCGGTLNITSSKDGLHCEDSDDDTIGWIYIYNGSLNITASADGIQGTSAVQIDGGTLNIIASEGIEATYVQINSGIINITASDDGINASNKSSAYQTPTIEFNGGDITIAVGQGDTDAVDANGDIIVNGGTINITAQMSSFDYDGTAQYNGGTIIINGTQVDSIPQSMMGGGNPQGGRGFR